MAGPAVAAGNLIVSRAWLADPAAELSIEDVVHRPFQPLDRPLARGYSDAAHWLRLTIKGPENGNQVHLRLGPPHIDEIRLFEPDGRGGWSTRVAGDRQPIDTHEVLSLQPGFILTVAAPQTTTVYLRMRTRSLSLLTATALEPLEAQARERTLDHLQLASMGLMVWLLLWSLYQALTYRDRLLGFLALNLAGFVAYGLSLAGYMRVWLPWMTPDQGDMLTSVAVCFWPFTLMLFDTAVLQRFRPARGWMAGCALLMTLFPIELAMLASDRVRETMELNYLATVLQRWYLFAMAWSVRGPGHPSLRFMRSLLGALALMFSLVMATEVGWLPASSSEPRRLIYAFVWNLIFGSLLFVLLRARFQERRNALEHAQVQAALSTQGLELERQHRQTAEQLANTDALTGLSNRRHFLELGNRSHGEALATGQPLSVLMIDLDHFKLLNDSLGHMAADEVLRSLAERMRAQLDASERIGRMGGEEFAVLLPGSNATQAQERAQALRAAVADTHFQLGSGGRASVTVSIGASTLTGRAGSLTELLHEADQALYVAKTMGRNTVRPFDAAVGADMHLRARILQALSGALAGNELSMVYQPVHSTRSGAPVGAEALLRWNNPELGDVAPSKFITTAEDCGLIESLGTWALHRACLDAARWPGALTVSVNLSARQLHSARLIEDVREALQQSGLEPWRLELEVTESALAEPDKAAEALAALRMLGVRLALDDFGTGYSSLAYLRRLPFDRLKIDRSFVQPLFQADPHAAQGLVQGIIDLARSLKLSCTAEGVESAEQFALLKRLGCDVVQGFHLARPMPPNQVLEYFTDRNESFSTARQVTVAPA